MTTQAQTLLRYFARMRKMNSLGIIAQNLKLSRAKCRSFDTQADLIAEIGKPYEWLKTPSSKTNDKPKSYYVVIAMCETGGARHIYPFFSLAATLSDNGSQQQLCPQLSESIIYNTVNLLDPKRITPEVCFNIADNPVQYEVQPAPNSDNFTAIVEHAITQFLGLCDQPNLDALMIDFAQKFRKRMALSVYTTDLVVDDNDSTNQLYDALIQDPLVFENTTLSRFLSVYSYTKPISRHLTTDELYQAMRQSPDYMLGHMDSSTDRLDGNLGDRSLDPLDNSQRFTLLAQALKPTEALSHNIAVNGPPGSGKTAMLKAVIAHQWVEAALHQKPCPIVAANGSTNVSVTNVIDAFGSVAQQAYSTDEMRLYQRWLPVCPSYGSYAAAMSTLSKQIEKDKDYTLKNTILQSHNAKELPTLFTWEGDFAMLSDYTALDEVIAHYVSCGNAYFGGGNMTVTEIKDKLHDKLVQTHKAMVQAHQYFYGAVFTRNHDAIAKHFNVSHAIEQMTRVKQQVEMLVSDNIKESCEALAILCREVVRDEGIDLDRLSKEDPTYKRLYQYASTLATEHYLDLTFRARLFHYTARYWEASYLIESKAKLLVLNNYDNRIEALRRVAMITPCVVSTLHNMPNLARITAHYDGRYIRDYLYGAFDLLITDETGQADIAQGLPLFSLTRNALTVGDVEQLQPVIQDFTLADEQITASQLGINDPSWQYWHQQKLTRLNGSVLTLSREASSVNYQGKGLLLRGHYRCQTQIIRYCDQLVYENKLFFLPFKSKENELYKPLSWVPIHSKASNCNGSKINTDEANMIVEFIFSQWPRIAAYYRNKECDVRIQDVIAIVSPFKTQFELIANRLKLACRKRHWSDERLRITESDIQAMKIGTVDAMQGAEKDIILFSGTHTIQNGARPFFAKKPFLLNVALSRAKQHFIAFICPEVYQVNADNNTDPTADSVRFLGRYLYECGQKLFPNHLFVVESQKKITGLRNILGCEYEFVATHGTVVELPYSDKGLSFADGLVPHYTPKEHTDDIIEDIVEKSKNLENIYLAMDDDHMGEAIAWHTSKLILAKAPQLKDKIKRVRLRAITPNAVTEAVKEATDIDTRMVASVIIREIADQLIAHKLSETNKTNHQQSTSLPHKWFSPLTPHKKIHLGRVKSGILDLIARRMQKANEVTATIATLEVNGKTLVGTVACDSRYTLPKLCEQQWHLNSWQSYDYALSAPSGSTIDVMKYAWRLNELDPVDTYNSLYSLYLGE